MRKTTLEIDDSMTAFPAEASFGRFPVEGQERPLRAAAPHEAEPAVAGPGVMEPAVMERAVAEAHGTAHPEAKSLMVDSLTATSLAIDPTAEAGGAHAAGPFPAAGFVALSKFEIANGMIEEVRSAFRDRPHLVDGAPGFLRMDVISPIEAPEEIWLITYWTDEPSYRSWHRSHVYRESHGGIPKGLKLRPRGTELRYFDHVCS